MDSAKMMTLVKCNNQVFSRSYLLKQELRQDFNKDFLSQCIDAIFAEAKEHFGVEHAIGLKVSVLFLMKCKDGKFHVIQKNVSKSISGQFSSSQNNLLNINCLDVGGDLYHQKFCEIMEEEVNAELNEHNEFINVPRFTLIK